MSQDLSNLSDLLNTEMVEVFSDERDSDFEVSTALSLLPQDALRLSIQNWLEAHRLEDVPKMTLDADTQTEDSKQRDSDTQTEDMDKYTEAKQANSYEEWTKQKTYGEKTSIQIQP
ncbi:unnamed protein product [Brassicogethes aeneus]|uniref:Uncharacterized protein n=1 Tax=Brassicogethes aeneus TaxID=1431903 RepID=A0A9P0BGL6_BRAAE|nr:unnamed protein product [Brassicogethes aeneus]